MLERLSKTRRNIGLAVVAIALLWFAWVVRAVLNPLILGYLLAYILRPLVQWLEKHKMGRRAAVNIIFSAFALVLTMTVFGIAVQGREVVQNVLTPTESGEDPIAVAEARIDDALDDARDWFEGLFGEDPAVEDGVVEPVESTEPAESTELTDPAEVVPGDVPGDPAGDAPAIVPGAVTPDLATDDDELTLRQLLRSWAADLSHQVDEPGGAKALATSVLDALQGIFGGVLSILAFLVLLPVYTYFLLFELERIHSFVRSHIPKRERGRATRIGRQVGSVVANFFRGRLLICFLKGAVIAVGLVIAGVPHAFLLGMTSGFLALVPFVGPVVGFAVTFLIGLQAMEIVEALLWIGPVFLVAETLEGYVLIPKILGDSLGLHPVVILVSVFAGGAALGLFGFLLAVPLAATAIILFRELVMPAVEEFAEEDSHVDEAPA